MERGKSRQEARGHKAAEHVERREKEVEKYGITLEQARRVRAWGEKRQRLQPKNAMLNTDDLVEWTKEHGFDKYRALRHAQEQRAREYKANPHRTDKLKRTSQEAYSDFDDLDEYDLDDLPAEWLYYH